MSPEPRTAYFKDGVDTKRTECLKYLREFPLGLLHNLVFVECGPSFCLLAYPHGWEPFHMGVGTPLGRVIL